MTTRGGVATYVRETAGTAFWHEWNCEHIATHRDGSTQAKLGVFLTALVRIVARLAFRRPDIIHIHTSGHGSFARKCVVTWLAAAFGVPIVLHIHDGYFDEFFRSSPRPVQALIRRTLECADGVIALGDTWANRFSLMAPAARIVAIPNAMRCVIVRVLPVPAPARMRSGPPS